MSYAVRSDLEGRYGAAEVAQRESMLGAGSVDRALADADAEIDSYLGGRYAVPLSPVPPNVPRLACAIARYNLLGDASTERARDDYTDAVRLLKDIQAGRAQLESAAALPGAAPAARVEITTSGRVFSREARGL